MNESGLSLCQIETAFTIPGVWRDANATAPWEVNAD